MQGCDRQAGLGLDALPIDGSVHKGAADAEQFGHLSGAVLTRMYE